MENELLYIQQTLQGNTSAFAHLVRLHKDRVYGLALRIVRSPQDAEELAQDVFVKAFENLHKFKGGSRLATWLFKITYNTAISFVRKKRLSTVALNEQVASYDFSAEKSARDKEEQLNKLELALLQLNEKDRSIVALHYLNHHAVAEIAAITGFSESSVKVKLHRARKKLQDLMEKLI
ncbi:MAG: RNA polymerase sigma factor [Prevotellaceae bacterium]|jgi:RNA polymerase sigma-70 factor (ECF subfamily)|nr:RNA polymerase sigma factor [Prevotellaceae bacterium]